jgi:hypothetical protein
MRKIVLLFWLPTIIAVRSGQAQTLADRLISQDFETGGIRFYGLTAFAGYASSAFPLAAGASSFPTSGVPLLGPDENVGVTGSLGWQHHRSKTDISVIYSGTYQRMVHYSNLDSYSQSLSLSASRSLTRRWRLNLSGMAQDASLAQSLFQPSTLLTQAPLSFNDLAATVSIGQFSNAQIASMLTGSPILESPTSSAVLGNRILSYSGQVTFEYAASSRLRFHFGSVSGGGQSRTSNPSGTARQTYILPHSFGLNAGAGFSYSLSPRTDVGLSAEGNRVSNVAQQIYTSSLSASFGRKMGMHWFLQVHGGESTMAVVAQTYGAPKSHEMIGGGALGFRTFRHSLVGSYNRASSDTFGFAVGAVTSYSGSWLYHTPGTGWTVFSTYAQQQMRNTGFLSLSGWQAGGGISESLNDHTSVTAQYVYLSNSGTYEGAPTSFAVHSVRLSVSWNPQPPRLSSHTP